MSFTTVSVVDHLWRSEKRPSDTLVVASLDRLSRSLPDLIATVADPRRRGIGFKTLH